MSRTQAVEHNFEEKKRGGKPVYYQNRKDFFRTLSSETDKWDEVVEPLVLG